MMPFLSSTGEPWQLWNACHRLEARRPLCLYCFFWQERGCEAPFPCPPEGTSYVSTSRGLQRRQRRLAELSATASRPPFGSVTQITKDQFVAEVTKASEEVWVVVHLYKDK